MEVALVVRAKIWKLETLMAEGHTVAGNVESALTNLVGEGMPYL